MTDTTEDLAETRPRGRGMRRGLLMLLWAQIALASLLVVNDLTRDRPLPFALPGTDRIDLPTGPVTPGDQRRTYRTDRRAPGFTAPQADPNFPLPRDLDDKLEFTLRDVEGFGRTLLVTGEISENDGFRFKAYLDDLAEAPETVAIHSPGGRMFEALAISREVRDRELKTLVPPGAHCFSSCPLILAGGTERHVSKRAAVGLHQAYYLEAPKLMPVFAAVEDIQAAQGSTMEHLIEMGVDPGVWVYALKTPPEQIYVLVEDELTETRLATTMVD
ncbi:MAG: hypothetical protein AAFX00_06040 [Pseudomonadota bacterium]